MKVWESADQMVKKEIIHRQEFSEKPTESARCTIHIKNLQTSRFSIKQIKEDLHSEILDEDSKKFILIGEACSLVDRYIERAIQSMCLYEHSLITLKIPRDDSRIIFDELLFEVTLEVIEYYRPIWIWTPEEKYKTAMKYKERGVELFKYKRYTDAFNRFSKACKFLITLEPMEGPEDIFKDILKLRHILYNNMAECHLIKKNYNHVLILCSKILNIDKHNVKALYRRGVAYGNLKDYENAVNDLKNVILLDPTNTKAQEQFNIYNKHWQVSVQGYEDIVRKMFNLNKL